MSEEERQPLSIRLSLEIKARLEDTARKLGLKPHALAQLAVEAAVEAIEQNENMLVLPIRFAADIKLDVTHVPTEKVRYPKGSIQPASLNETKRVLNSSKGISDKTRKEIEEAALRDLNAAFPPKDRKAS